MLKSSSQPLVSVGIPLYNAERYLSDCLESLINQDYTNIEIILSDNASSDSSALICSKYCARDSRIRYHRNHSNLGSPSNFRQVLTLAHGEFFMWAGADDYYDPNWISSLVKAVIPGKTIAFGQVSFIDEAGLPIRSIANSNTLDFSGPRIFRALSFIYSSSFIGKMILTWSLFPRKSLLALVDISIIEKWGTGWDLMLAYYSILQHPVPSVKGTRFYKRIHPDAESSLLGIKPIHSSGFLRHIHVLKSLFLVHGYLSFSSSTPLRLSLLIYLSSPLGFIYHFLASSIRLFVYKSPLTH